MIADGSGSEGRKMQKCGDKFCSKPEIKLNCDVHECVTKIQANHPEWKGACFYHCGGAGCNECGGRMIRASGCSHCIECGWSSCG